MTYSFGPTSTSDFTPSATPPHVHRRQSVRFLRLLAKLTLAFGLILILGTSAGLSLLGFRLSSEYFALAFTALVAYALSAGIYFALSAAISRDGRISPLIACAYSFCGAVLCLAASALHFCLLAQGPTLITAGAALVSAIVCFFHIAVVYHTACLSFDSRNPHSFALAVPAIAQRLALLLIVANAGTLFLGHSLLKDSLTHAPLPKAHALPDLPDLPPPHAAADSFDLFDPQAGLPKSRRDALLAACLQQRPLTPPQSEILDALLRATGSLYAASPSIQPILKPQRDGSLFITFGNATLRLNFDSVAYADIPNADVVQYAKNRITFHRTVSWSFALLESLVQKAATRHPAITPSQRAALVDLLCASSADRYLNYDIPPFDPSLDPQGMLHLTQPRPARISPEGRIFFENYDHARSLRESAIIAQLANPILPSLRLSVSPVFPILILTDGLAGILFAFLLVFKARTFSPAFHHLLKRTRTLSLAGWFIAAAAFLICISPQSHPLAKLPDPASAWSLLAAIAGIAIASNLFLIAFLEPTPKPHLPHPSPTP